MFDWNLFLGCGIGAAAGMPFGYFLGFRRVRTAAGDKLVPVIDHRPLRQRLREANPREALRWVTQRWLLVVMVSVLIAGFAQSLSFTYTQRQCNDQLWSAIGQRAAIADDTEMARKENDEAVYDLFTTWLSLVPNAQGANRDLAIDALRKFNQTYADNVTQQQQNAAKRAATPLPRC